MARTSKKAKPVPVDAVADKEIRSVGDIAAKIVAAVPETNAGEPTAPDAAIVNGATIYVPLNRLKKHPSNARKTPHSTASIAQKAASIAAKGILQNLIVEPELDGDGQHTGDWLVAIGEGRRQAQLLRASRGEIADTELIRCVVDIENDPAEISLDENYSREDLHPADEFEKFRDLSKNRGWGPEEIAALFGVTAHVVRQRLRLAAVSPRLVQVYRDGGLNMDQLMAFAITEDHARQEQVFDSLSYNREAAHIRREMTRTHIRATDRLAVFVGAEAYIEAGGTILRDLFTEDRGGFYEDPVLLDEVAAAKLTRIATELREAEGWKWSEAYIDFPYSNGFRRVYPGPVDLSEEDDAALTAAREEYDTLTEKYQDADELPPDVDERFGELEAEIERIEAKEHAYDPDEIRRAGIIVAISHDGSARIERGFVRPEDEEPEVAPEDADDEDDGVRVNEDGEIIEDDDPGTGNGTASDPEDEEPEDDGKPISDALVRDLTAHRTLGLRLALGEQPDIALIAVTHALVAQTFYRGFNTHCLDIRPASSYLASHADGIEDTAAAKALADRHGGWAEDLPRDVAELWDFIAGLDHASVIALFAHCASLTINAVRLSSGSNPRSQTTADSLATALSLDMTAHWEPTMRAYLGRVTKAHIIAAVREVRGDEEAKRIASKKKQEMAEEAEGLLAGSGWLPSLMRTAHPAWLDTDPADPAPEPEQIAGDEAGPETPDADVPEPAEPDGEDFTIAAE